ncbi:MAG: type I-E CRISPR-associated protein Cse1/CasA, partial [Pseudomonadales bacterium]|nr:type I-E CRISPR-associated protein Cse1/CasA [Pseudomonadales bacterium]
SLIAQYRLLLAIFHRALTRAQGRWKVSDRQHWYREGLPQEVIRDYLEHWRERFWLFHREHPFMQVAALAQAEETRDKQKPWTVISLGSASGNAAVVFDHSCDAAVAPVAASTVLRALLGFYQFTPGGLVKTLRDADKAGPLSNTAAVLPLGASLAQTLCLALHKFTEEGHEDLPCWERAVPGIAQLRGEPTLASGPNDRYTRQTRAVLLLPDVQGKVQWIRFAAGLALAEDEHQPDPMASYKAKANGDGMLRLTFTEGRAFWRDLPALLPDATGKSSKAAYVLDLAVNVNTGVESNQQRLLVSGLACESGRAKLLRWRSERFVLPSVLLSLPDCAYELRRQTREAEELFDYLRKIAVGMIADTLPDPGSKDSWSRARDLFDAGPGTPLFFATVERVLGQVMNLLARQEVEAADAVWKQTLWNAANIAWQAVFDDLGLSPRALRAEAKHAPRLFARLRDLRPATVTPSTTTQEVHP